MNVEHDADILNRAQLELIDLEVSKEQNTSISNLLRKVVFNSPSNSKVKLIITKQKGFISSSISIQSLQGPFDSSVVGETLEESLEFLYEDILSKINTWKQGRFGAKAPAQIA